MPSASTTVPDRSASALTALTISAMSAVARCWTSRRSSLITSGRSSGSRARDSRSAPTSSSAIPQPRRADARDEPQQLGRVGGQRPLGELDDDAQTVVVRPVIWVVVGETRAEGVAGRLRLDVDEQRPRVDADRRLWRRAMAAVRQARSRSVSRRLAPGDGEEQVGALERAAQRTSGERLEGDHRAACRASTIGW